MDELTRRLDAARPALPRRGEPLEAAAETRLHEIAHPPRPGSRRPLYLSVAAAVVVFLAATIGIAALGKPSTSFAAATPPLLEPTPVDGSPEDLLMQLSENAAPTSAGGTVRFQSWSLSLVIGDDGAVEQSSIEPEVRTFEHGDGGSRIEVRRGQPYDSDGAPIEVDGYDVGSLIWEQDFGPGEYAFVFGTPPTTAAEFGPFLEQPLGRTGITTGDAILQLGNLLSEQRLDAGQLRAALQFLAGRPDLRVEGSVEDRLGRAGLSFVTESRSPGEYAERIIVSNEGLGILSIETTFIGHDRTDIPSPAVINYTAWE
ncbi:hypothetical protein M3147_03010 [Agromyces mediolanus]|uniref:hypothetical protein n=1 Tax=Agromyces mediolanus TaxID=41986 RepID=UPI00203E9ACA|nr:hypothetical protein [Agromyces mediolanus]MCM3656215.1 hypothetical protein [Agromyces mediolanus]